MGLELAILGGAAIGTGGAWWGASEQADAAEKAAKAQTQTSQNALDTQWKMYEQAREDMSPFRNAGVNALGAMTGKTREMSYSKDPITGEYERYRGNEAFNFNPGRFSIEDRNGNTNKGHIIDYEKGGNWVPVSSLSGTLQNEYDQAVKLRGSVKRNEGWVDSDAGPKDYFSEARTALESYGNLDPSTGLPNTDVGKGIDPMAGQMDINTGLGNRPDLPTEFNVDLDALENDPITKWKREQAAKSMNKGLMARGKYDSRAGVNALADADMSVLAGEVDRQYGREVDKYNRNYGREMDLYGIGLNEGNMLYSRGTDQADKKFQRKYGMAIDKYNRDMGQNDALWNRNQSQQWNMFNALNALGGQDYNNDLDMVKLSMGAANTTGQGALATGQGVANTYSNLGNNLASSAYAKGNANANFASGLGGLPGNALASGYYYDKLFG